MLTLRPRGTARTFTFKPLMFVPKSLLRAVEEEFTLGDIL